MGKCVEERIAEAIVVGVINLFKCAVVIAVLIAAIKYVRG
jgi:hypothetical protein